MNQPTTSGSEPSVRTHYLTAEEADAIYDVLVGEAGADESGRLNFTWGTQGASGAEEYRFGGSLGFGGKFWNCNGRWYVTAYPEDVQSRPDRTAVVDRTNQVLSGLRIGATRPLPSCPTCDSQSRDGDMKAGRNAVDRGDGPEWCDDEWHDEDDLESAPYSPVSEGGEPRG